MKTLIIEDEKAALRNLKAAMKEVDAEFEIVGETDSVTGTLEWFAFHPMPDLVFMDIHLADGSAFGISNKLILPALSFLLLLTMSMPYKHLK